MALERSDWWAISGVALGMLIFAIADFWVEIIVEHTRTMATASPAGCGPEGGAQSKVRIWQPSCLFFCEGAVEMADAMGEGSTASTGNIQQDEQMAPLRSPQVQGR